MSHVPLQNLVQGGFIFSYIFALWKGCWRNELLIPRFLTINLKHTLKYHNSLYMKKLNPKECSNATEFAIKLSTSLCSWSITSLGLTCPSFPPETAAQKTANKELKLFLSNKTPDHLTYQISHCMSSSFFQLYSVLYGSYSFFKVCMLCDFNTKCLIYLEYYSADFFFKKYIYLSKYKLRAAISISFLLTWKCQSPTTEFLVPW